MSAVLSLLYRRSFLGVTRNGGGRSLTLKKTFIVWRNWPTEKEFFPKLFCGDNIEGNIRDVGDCTADLKISILLMISVKENGRILNPLESIVLPILCVHVHKEKTWHLEIQVARNKGGNRKKMAIKKKNICNKMPRLMGIVRK